MSGSKPHELDQRDPACWLPHWQIARVLRRDATQFAGGTWSAALAARALLGPRDGGEPQPAVQLGLVQGRVVRS
jgi:hypothetical protein